MLYPLPKNVYSLCLVSTLAITTHQPRCCEDRGPRAAAVRAPPWAFMGPVSIVPTSYMLGPEVHASVTCVGFTNDPHSLICRKATRRGFTPACNTSGNAVAVETSYT
jgi:hypothetical protein